MLLAAQDAVFFTAGRSRSDLDTNRMFARALLHAIQEIGKRADHRLCHCAYDAD